MSTSLVGSGENIQSSEYVYDHMGRLLAGSIEFVGKVGNKYDVSTSYNKAGGLESKVSSPDASTQVYAGTSQEMTYDLTYQYSGTKPHQLSEVISSQGVPYAMSFSYNASGSISEITDMMGVDHSSYYWGQEQWLCGVENTQGIHHYVYDHAGERIMKSSITQTTVQLNDETINTVTTLEPYTLYVNPYYVVTSFSNADQRSKHYYMGTQRVATDIGVDYGMSPSPEQTERARGGDDAAMTEATQGLETDQVPFQSLGYKQDLERVLLGLSGEIGVEDLSEALAPIESFYPELSAGVNSGEGIESEPPLYIGTRIMYWYHPDYVSNVDMVTDKSGEAYELFLYNAWGESLHHWSSSSTNSWSSPYRLNSKELDSETGMHYYGARYHHPKLSVWMSVDPLAHQTLEAYQFTGNNPIYYVDPDGREPIKPFAGTVSGFMTFFNGLSSGIGASKGSTAHAAMLRMGSVNWNNGLPSPAATAPFNTAKINESDKTGNRYIYTKKGGWIDMSHFMFYAGRGYQAKLDKQQAQDLIKGMLEAGIPYSEIPKNLISTSMSDPVGEAVQEGYMQEMMDQYGPTYSAYSYEDLPSDKFGADFSVNYFDSNSELSFGEQLQNYLNNVLGATNPKNAPNYENLPTEYPVKGELPSVQNRTTQPMFIKE
jgi:RHS repeat-associated protein